MFNISSKIDGTKKGRPHLEMPGPGELCSNCLRIIYVKVG